MSVLHCRLLPQVNFFLKKIKVKPVLWDKCNWVIGSLYKMFKRMFKLFSKCFWRVCLTVNFSLEALVLYDLFITACLIFSMVSTILYNVKIVLSNQLLSVILSLSLFLNTILILEFARGPVTTQVLISKEEMQKVYFESRSLIRVYQILITSTIYLVVNGHHLME